MYYCPDTSCYIYFEKNEVYITCSNEFKVAEEVTAEYINKTLEDYSHFTCGDCSETCLSHVPSTAKYLKLCSHIEDFPDRFEVLEQLYLHSVENIRCDSELHELDIVTLTGNFIHVKTAMKMSVFYTLCKFDVKMDWIYGEIELNVQWNMLKSLVTKNIYSYGILMIDYALVDTSNYFYGKGIVTNSMIVDDYGYISKETHEEIEMTRMFSDHLLTK